MKKGILFDLDGTLWDSSREVADSWMMALKDFADIENPITREDIKAVMGKPMDEIGDILFARLPQARREELLEHCMQVENQYIREHGGQLLPGLVETLKILKQQYHLSIVSNCQVGYIEAFLSYHRLEAYFDDFESFGRTRQPKGENIRLVVQRNHLDAAVYVGDTQGDYEAASFAGTPFVHARTGYGTVQARVPYIESLSQLPETVERLFKI